MVSVVGPGGWHTAPVDLPARGRYGWPHHGGAYLSSSGAGDAIGRRDYRRGVEVGDGHVALVGRPVVVDDDAVDDVLALLRAAPDQALSPALRWPEVREHTAAGELVQHCFRCYELPDPGAAVGLLRAAPSIIEDVDVVTYWEDDVAFKVYGSPIAEVVEPPHETGATWELCDEDASDPPLLGARAAAAVMGGVEDSCAVYIPRSRPVDVTSTDRSSTSAGLASTDGAHR
jgi:hypothetical protein